MTAMASIDTTEHAAVEPAMTQQQRRRLAFIRAQRLSLEEAPYIPPDFDPGPAYDLEDRHQ